MFNNLVATLRADLDAIKDDLGEFVSTVKTDTSAILGIARDSASAGARQTASAKVPQWEEELWENPDILCEDPQAEDWETFDASAKEEEIEALLSGAGSGIVADLYKELVPARATHAEFFKRLFYHRDRLTKALRNRMQVLEDDEEETGWDDDDEDIPIPTQSAAAAIPAPAPVPSVDPAQAAALEQAQTLVETLKAELEECRKALEASKEDANKLREQLEEMEAARDEALSENAKLRAQLDETEKFELPHKKAAQAPIEKEESRSETRASETPGASWEALPISPSSSSNEEAVMLEKKSGGAGVSAEEDEEEEDDWE